MDSEYWDLNIATPQSLHGSARAVPGESMPLDGTRASRALRIQQLSFLRNGFPLGIIPAYSPPLNKDLGHFSLQSLLFKTVSSNWYCPFFLFVFIGSTHVCLGGLNGVLWV